MGSEVRSICSLLFSRFIAQSTVSSDCLFSAGQVKKGQPRRTKKTGAEWRLKKWQSWRSTKWPRKIWPRFWRLTKSLDFSKHIAILISHVQWTKLEKLQGYSRLIRLKRLKHVIPAWHLLTSGPWMSSSKFPFPQDPPKVIWLQSLDFVLLSLSKAPCASTKRVTLELWKKAKRNWDNGQLQSCKRPCTMIFEAFLNWWIPKPWVSNTKMV